MGFLCPARGSDFGQIRSIASSLCHRLFRTPTPWVSFFERALAPERQY